MSFILNFDIFTTTKFLKINGKSSYQSKVGAILTLIFILVIIAIFIIRIV